MADVTQYTTARTFMPALATWLPEADAERLGAYTLYENMYWNETGTFALVQRGTNERPIYIPSARAIIEATNRFLAKQWNFAVDPRIGTPQERALVQTMMQNLFAREQMYVKFATQKRFGLIRGDAVWHITADPLKQEGHRLSVWEVDPAAYFPIEDPDNPDRIVGVHLVDPLDNGDGQQIIRRQTYRKGTPENFFQGPITYDVTWWELGGWDDRAGSGQELKPASPPSGLAPIEPVVLPPVITSIPVYHVKNFRAGLAPFGSSEIRGLETITAGVNQRITDQDLALALEGLGMYVTTSTPPVDDQGNETTWKIGPGYVAEIDPEADWRRVPGVSGIDGSIAHMDWLKAQMQEASGTPDIAIGRVDVNVAESGIALQFKMAPILAKNEEKEQEILSVMDHLLYDLVHMWFPAYEALQTSCEVVSIVGDPMPVNRAAVLKEVIDMLSTTPPLISAEYARTILSEKLGYDFPENMAQTVVDEAQAYANARNFDPFLERVQRELAADGQAV
jgi:hypothetical protein